MLPLVIVVALLTALLAGAGKQEGPDAAMRQKAQYYYLEGARWQSVDSLSRAYEYYKKAHLVDPGYAEAANAYAQMRLLFTESHTFDSEAVDNLLQLMKMYTDSFPEDFYEASYYAYVAAQVDTTGEAVRVLERTYNIYPQRTALLLNLADLYLMNGDTPKALAAYSNYEKAEGRNVQVTIKKASTYLSARDTTAAVAEIDSLIAEYPLDYSYLALKGKFYSLLNRQDSALYYLQLAERLDPENGSTKLSLAEYYKEQGDSVAYDNKIYEALLTEDFSAQEKTALMADYLQKLINDRRNTKRGDNLFSVLRNQYPHDADVIDLSARYSAAKGNFNDAIEEISYAIDLNPANATLPQQLMSYQLSAERYEDAIETYRKMYDSGRYAEADEAMLYLSVAASNAKQYDLADSVLQKMFHQMLPDVNPLDSLTDNTIRHRLGYENILRASSLLSMMGDTYYMQGEMQKSYTCYGNAIFFFPQNAGALNNYAYHLSEHGGDLSRALELSQKALEIDGDNPTYIDTFAWILYKLNRLDDAISAQEEAIEKAEKAGDASDEYYLHFAIMLKDDNKTAEALESVNKGLAINADNAQLKALQKELTKRKR